MDQPRTRGTLSTVRTEIEDAEINNCLASRLLEKEALDGHEIDQILKESIPQWAPS